MKRSILSGFARLPQSRLFGGTYRLISGRYYVVYLKKISREFQGQGVMASVDLILKEIASQSHTSAIDLFEIIKTIVKDW